MTPFYERLRQFFGGLVPCVVTTRSQKVIKSAGGPCTPAARTEPTAKQKSYYYLPHKPDAGQRPPTTVVTTAIETSGTTV
ncbi:hypothetical protein EVAR_92194_1 [Eumeta japonica]|uniref:Uncharacterized protein n=1 Tax=Eumeta variegata TaxID=151549 RepID=A0A4C1S9H3_EUMVA|nr:hypothetical protein EVAR_92194_1 [Eumeta japonica]